MLLEGVEHFNKLNSMRKIILDLGNSLSKKEQQTIKGGYSSPKECSMHCNGPCIPVPGTPTEWVCA